MPQALRWLSRFALVLLALVAVLAAIWAYARLSSPTAAQQAAMALMQQDAPGEGENGYPLLLALPEGPPGPLPEALNCGSSPQADCLALIEAAPEASAAAIEPYRMRLEAAARALHAPVFRDLREGRATDALPAFAPVLQLESLRALDFLAGNTTGALASACEDAAGAARWAANPNTLIDAMVGVAAFRSQALLIAEMRHRAPAEALPSACLPLAEPPDASRDGTLCEAMRGEYRWLSGMLPSIQDELPQGSGPAWMAPLLHDVDWLLARSAERYAATCGPDAEAAARADRPASFARIEVRWVDRIGFPVSAVLDDIAEPAFQDYPDRQLDFVAQRRLLAAFLQMEAMDPALDNAARFAALPADLRDGPRPLRLADGGTGLAVPLRARGSGGEAGLRVLPLPARPLKPATPGPVAARP